MVVANELGSINMWDSYCIVGGNETRRYVFPHVAGQKKRVKMVLVSNQLLVFF